MKDRRRDGDQHTLHCFFNRFENGSRLTNYYGRMPRMSTVRAFFRPRPSRGGQSLHNGKAEELRTADRLRSILYNKAPIQVGDTAGGTHGVDIPTVMGGINVGIEVGTKGKFEGGGTVLRIVDGALRIPDSSPLLQTLMGDRLPWNGVIPGLHQICPDDRLPVPSDSIANYYRAKGAHYITLPRGLYHTGVDILALGVPFFAADNIFLRTRVTKHMKNGKPTDYSTALVFSPSYLPTSPYSFFGPLPPGFTEV